MLKRLFDFTVASIGLIIIFPVIILIAAAIKLSSPGRILFLQERVGLKGKVFRICKFRTMVDRPNTGRQITVGADPRITRIGHLLRKSKLDELPQLFNVISGTMSFVGPRPEVPKYVAMYTNEQQRVLDVRPGITDLASIRYRYEAEILAGAEDPEHEYIHTVMPQKLEINLEYISQRSFLSDVKVLLLTGLALLHKAPLKEPDSAAGNTVPRSGTNVNH